MLTEAGIDLDNLQIAAFVLDGHGGDERSDQVALWRRVWEAVAALPRGRFHRLPFLLNGEDLVVLYSSGEEIAPMTSGPTSKPSSRRSGTGSG